jgi:hypothetical protein
MRSANVRIAVIAILARAAVSGSGAVEFEPPVTVGVAGAGVGTRLVMADWNGNCSADLVLNRDYSTAGNDPSLNYVPGSGNGSFGGVAQIDGGQQVSDMAAGDIDGDTAFDLITTEDFPTQTVPAGICGSQTPKVPVFLGSGTGGFTLLACLTARDHPSAVETGDFNGDGRVDLLVVNAPTASSGVPSPEAVFFAGRGDGTFLGGTIAFTQRADDLAVADFNGDGRLDVVLAARSTTYQFRGMGDGTFTLQGSAITGASRRVVVGDINGDGAPDLAAVGSAVSQTNDDVVWVALNDGNGGFGFATSYPTGQHPVGVAVADLNQDGRGDVVVANALSNNVSVHTAGAGGALSAAQLFAAGQTPAAVVAGDFNDDGFPDLAVSDRNEVQGMLGDGAITVLVQRVTAPLAVATASLPCGEVGRPYASCLEARGGVGPRTWSIAAGSLPAGLALNPDSGRVAGTPTREQVASFTARVEDANLSVATRALGLATQIDHDLDRYLACRGDCDDLDPASFPGNPEVCDGRDNDCAGGIDNLPPPAGSPSVTATHAAGVLQLAWTTLAGASGYDVVRGGLYRLWSTSGDYTLAVDACAANGTPLMSLDYAGSPPADDGWWFLVRGENCGQGGTWDSGGAGQVGMRDTEIDVAPLACP